MSYEELAQRVQALEGQMECVHVLEEEVAHLKEQVRRLIEKNGTMKNGQAAPGPVTSAEAPKGPSTELNQKPILTEDDLIDGCECDIVLNVPAKREYTVQARIVSWERGSESFSLSKEEWASLQLEDEDA